jgi:NADPH2:quinone reductase
VQALGFSTFGGPEVLEWSEVPEPVVGPGQCLVGLEAIGLNFADIYRRQGRYHLAGTPPWIAGYEGAGVVLSAPAGAPLAVGDRVGFADAPFANAERVAVDLERLIPLPADVACATAAAVLLQGLTAQYLVRDSHPLAAGQWVVVHAAAGGVGLLLTQMARLLGGRVVALASSAAKREAALAAGAEVALGYDGDWVEQVRAHTGGGADAVFDSVGTTLEQSLAAARTGGRVVFFGMAGGTPAGVDPRVLMDRSLTLTGGDLWNVLRTREERVGRAAELFGWVREGKVKVKLAGTFPLAEGAAAHRFLEGRGAIGKILLLVAGRDR